MIQNYRSFLPLIGNCRVASDLKRGEKPKSVTKPPRHVGLKFSKVIVNLGLRSVTKFRLDNQEILGGSPVMNDDVRKDGFGWVFRQ